MSHFALRGGGRSWLALAGVWVVGALATPVGGGIPPHVHNWSVNPALTAGVQVGKSYPVVNEVITVGGGMGPEMDTCQTYTPPCSFPNNQAANQVVRVTWSDGGAGGTFGKMVNGQFQGGCPASEVTHYKCPPNPGNVTITVTVDDVPRAVDPATQQVIATADDAQATSNPGATIHVWAVTSPPDQERYQLSNAIPATSGTITCQASLPCYWGCMPRQHIGIAWGGEAQPATTRTFSFTTANNRPGDPKNGRLPDSNGSFGNYFVQAWEEHGESNMGRGIRLFFGKDGTNNPTTQGIAVPNWYYYWKQTSANYETHTYDPNCPAPGYGYCTWAGVITIGPNAGGTHAWYPNHSGIDLYALVCRHEGKHKSDYAQWWPGGAYNPLLDTDQDGVNDNFEAGLGYMVGDSDTDDDGHIDMEDSAEDWSLANWNVGDSDAEDWAHPGKQWP